MFLYAMLIKNPSHAYHVEDFFIDKKTKMTRLIPIKSYY